MSKGRSISHTEGKTEANSHPQFREIEKMLEVLIKLGGLKYLMRIIADLLIDRLLYCYSEDRTKSHQTTCTASQGTVLEREYYRI